MWKKAIATHLCKQATLIHDHIIAGSCNYSVKVIELISSQESIWSHCRLPPYSALCEGLSGKGSYIIRRLQVESELFRNC